jgi:hypothetical protein
MPLAYDDVFVKLTYHIVDPDDYEPSQKELDNFFRLLEARYDKIDSIMAEYGIPPIDPLPWRIALLAVGSNGSPGWELRNACRYHKNAWP